MKILILIGITLFFISCSSDVGVNSRISGCGGFKGNSIQKVCNDKKLDLKKSIKPLDEDGMCSAYLSWEYSPESKKLALTHSNAFLNCCGERSISVTNNENGSYTIIESDEPEIGGGRCDCMCTYAFYTELPNIKKGIIKINLKEDIEDGSVTTLLNNGTIDLTQSNKGEIFIKKFHSMGSCIEH